MANVRMASGHYPSSPLLPGLQTSTSQGQTASHVLAQALTGAVNGNSEQESSLYTTAYDSSRNNPTEGLFLGQFIDDGRRGRLAQRVERDPEERKASMRRVATHTWNRAAEHEPSLDEEPLVLIGTPSSSSDRKDIILDESRRCFASHWPGILAPDFCRYIFDELLEHAPWQELLNKKGQVTRETCWYVRGGCRCDYTYGTARVKAKRKPSAQFRSIMEKLLAKVIGRVCPWLPLDAWPNSANLNLYSEARQSVGWHADDESLFMGRDQDCPILSVSLGSRREFWIALQHDAQCMEPSLKSIVEVDLCDGDVMTMEGLCQKHCVHFVPCDVRPEDGDETRARINVTWRWIRDHKLRCPKRALSESQGIGTLFCNQPGLGRPPGPAESAGLPRLILDTWTDAKMAWRSCDDCDHDAWRGGRNCVRHNQQWLCRLCYKYALSGAPPRPPLPRRPRPRRQPLSQPASLEALALECQLQQQQQQPQHPQFGMFGQRLAQEQMYLMQQREAAQQAAAMHHQRWQAYQEQEAMLQRLQLNQFLLRQAMSHPQAAMNLTPSSHVFAPQVGLPLGQPVQQPAEFLVPETCMMHQLPTSHSVCYQ